ncbi:Trp biosynthesis-associated membrane protein [Agromyces laixinhei]|uniref:Trp biosynthesis-associated membrane protein n=1 Tax=Agromyces laixinhei TaxID=2585717 RepID=UPI0012EDAF82|nr:Trp biosynthesis-associated membrane protein [Agromyces laixinhei]
MTPARMKLPAIVATVVGAGLVLLSWSQTWFDLLIESSTIGGTGEPVAVAGSVASPALAALGLAGLAIAPALAIAGLGVRFVLGVLEVLLGGCVLLAASLSLAGPVAAVSPAVTEATGVAGAEPTAELVASVTATVWPAPAIAGGALLVLAGLAVLVTGGRWPASSRRYADSRMVSDGTSGSAAARPASDRAIDDWDGLSRGDDPTDDAASPILDAVDDDADAADGARPSGDEGTSGANR